MLPFIIVNTKIFDNDHTYFLTHNNCNKVNYERPPTVPPPNSQRYYVDDVMGFF